MVKLGSIKDNIKKTICLLVYSLLGSGFETNCAGKDNSSPTTDLRH